MRDCTESVQQLGLEAGFQNEEVHVDLEGTPGREEHEGRKVGPRRPPRHRANKVSPLSKAASRGESSI